MIQQDIQQDIQQEVDEESDSAIVASGGKMVGAFLNMSAQSQQVVINISAKLEDSEDSSVVIDLFQQNAIYVNEIVRLRKRNCDLITQITTSLPNYSKIKNELEAKFESYKADLEKGRMTSEVQYAKTIDELKQQNALLQRENDELKSVNKALLDKVTAAMELQMEVDRAQMKEDREVASLLKTKLEDIEFRNCSSDVFLFLRDGIIAKHNSVDFPKGVSPLPCLKYPEELRLESEDEEDEEEESMTDEERAQLEKEKADLLATVKERHDKATNFISSLGLDPTLILDMYRMNKSRNDETHDDDCKLLTSKKITSAKNAKALSEIQTSLLKLHAGHAAYHIKDRLLLWVQSCCKDVN